MSGRRPSGVKACRDFVGFVSSLNEGSYLWKIVRDGLDLLKGNMFVGERIERKKFPRFYVQRFGVNNLFKLNLDSRMRLVYTLVADEGGVAVVVLEVLDHKKYEERFGYR